MTHADDNQHSPFRPSRRNVVRAAAWSVPAISIAAASPAFAASPQPGVSDPITFTSGMFWRPEEDEITNPDEQGLWGFLPSGSIIWITQITNLGTAPASISLELAGPPITSASPAKGFRVLDTGN